MQGVITSPFRGQFPVGVSQGVGPWTPGGWSPVSLQNVNGGAITYGQQCYVFGNGTVKLAQSNGTEAEATCTCICIDTTIANNATGRFVFGGRVPGLSGGVANALAYLSTTPGARQAAPNLTAGQYNVLLGIWLNTTTLQFNPQLPILN